MYIVPPTNSFKTMKKIGLLAALLAFASACSEESQKTVVPDEHVRIVETINTDGWNTNIEAGTPTVDVGIYLPETEDVRYNTRVPLDTLMARVAYAQEIYEGVGVQLNILWIKKFEVPDSSWLTIQSNTMEGEPGEAAPQNMYERMGLQRSALSEGEDESNADRDLPLPLVISAPGEALESHDSGLQG